MSWPSRAATSNAWPEDGLRLYAPCMSRPDLSTRVTDFVRLADIVDAGSFAEAARRAGTTTSAMSKAIRRIEQAHNVRLLHRTTHGLSLTGEGERILSNLRDLLQQVERLETSLADVGTDCVSGRVRLTAPSAFARACLVPLIPPLLARHPALDIELSLQDTLANLGADGVDIAIRSGPLDGLPGHLVRRLGTFPWILCAAPDYLSRRGTPSSPAGLESHEQIAFRNPATGRVVPWRFKDPTGTRDAAIHRHAPTGRLVFDDGDAGWAMVRAGLGISWAPIWLGLDDIRAGRVVEIMRDQRVEETMLSAVRLGGHPAPPRTQAVLDFLVEASPSWDVASQAT